MEQIRLALYHVDAHLAAVAHIIAEALGAVVAKAVVIADDQLLDTKLLMEDELHELAGTQRGQRKVEMHDHDIVDTRAREQHELVFEGGQQLRLIVLLQYLTGMQVEGDDHRPQTTATGFVGDLSNEEAVAAVHAVEETDGGHGRLQVLRVVFV